MTGYVRGGLGDRVGAEELLSTARDSVEIAKRPGVSRLNLYGTVLGADRLPLRPATEFTGVMWMQARDALSRLTDLGDEAGVTFVLEKSQCTS